MSCESGARIPPPSKCPDPAVGGENKRAKMTRRKTPATPAKVTTIRHAEKRPNIPTSETRGFAQEFESAPKIAKYARNWQMDPQLIWRGKFGITADELSLDIPAVPLYIQEKIHPQAIVENIRRDSQATMDMFDDFNGLPKEFEKKVDFYQHKGNWQNRMILGDSLYAMNSLLQKEGMRGKAQMIYMDPPYGIDFKANWMKSTQSRNVKDQAKNTAREPEVIKAYRDTWQLKTHSYLSYLRDRLVIARELLSDSGSCFVQIGDENAHLVRALMDEIFGRDNYMTQISFVTTTARGASHLDKIFDYLIWYAKDKSAVKYRQIFIQKTSKEIIGQYNFIELNDGKIINVKDADSKDMKMKKRFSHSDTTSQDETATGSFSVKFEGKIYKPPPDRHWSTTKEGMDRLITKNRIFVIGNRLRYKRYLSDYPVHHISNLWGDTSFSGFGESKQYVVQTLPTVIQRCILMTTDPSDLVIDPTCGGGTTAFVAEQWGRRWITMDTSRVALALARTRLMAAKYPAYLLADSAEGRKKQFSITAIPSSKESPKNDVRNGFVYERVPHITLKSIANNEKPATEILYDRPYEDENAVRVCGPFTVESLSPHRLLPVDGDSDGGVSELESESFGKFADRMIEQLREAGIKGQQKGQRVSFDKLERREGGQYVQADGEFINGKNKMRKAAIAFGPEFGSVSEEFVKEAAKESMRGEGCDILYICNFAAEAGAMERAKQFGKLSVQFVQMNAELRMDDKLKKTQAANLFTVFGEPDIMIRKREKGRVKVFAEGKWQMEKDGGDNLEENEMRIILRGVDIFDPADGEVRSAAPDEIACWFIDSDYDGESFFVRHAYFTGADDPFGKLKRALKAEIDESAWEALYSTESKPFPIPASRDIDGVKKCGKIAVKVINHFGDEVLCVRECE